jgi:iron complex outermembrane receptor protein
MFTLRGASLLRTGVVLAVLLIVPTSPLSAQARGVLIGTIVDRGSDEPIEGVVVSVVDTDVVILSGEDGRFAVSYVGGGELTLRAELPGYFSVVETVEVTAAETGFVQMRLGSFESMLEELVVTAQRGSKDSGSSVGEVFADDIGDLRTALDLLSEQVPGLMIRGGTNSALGLGTGAKIRLRGSSSITGHNDPTIYVDGVLEYDGRRPGSTSLHVLELINASDISRIRVLRGPAAGAEFAEAFNGVILIETNKGVAR